MKTPTTATDREELLLACYGMRSRDTRGREHEEPESPLRTPFQRDRDRIIHSTAFRRLEYKTQVFVNHEGDHYRTRLTHTLEVAQIARAVARGLSLNEDLVEAIALSHDLGHPPFGHAGEDQLDELMSGHGGFNHNRQSHRVVTRLEKRYPNFEGLNLTWEVREAMVKHCGPDGNPEFREFEPASQPTLEAQLVDLCDSLAYSNHDIDDGIRSRYLSVEELREVELWRMAETAVSERWPGIDQRHLVARTISDLIDTQVLDLLSYTRDRLEGIDSVDEARGQGEPLLGFSPEITNLVQEMQRFLHERLYKHPRTIQMAEKGKRFVAALFTEFRREPSQLPVEFQVRAESERDLERVICDYIAGMTDRYCTQEYQRFFVPD